MMNKVQIAVKNLTIGYGDFVLLKDLNFNINRGDVFIIMGGSGAAEGNRCHRRDGFYQSGAGGARRNHAPFGYFVPERGVVQLYDAGGKHCSAA